MKLENIDLNYIVITGATGWVGRTALHELQRILPKDIFLNHVKAFASKNSLIPASFYNDNTQIPIFSLKELPIFAKKNKLSAIFHSAFLRREKISSIGLNQYLNVNNEINEIVSSAMALSNDAKIVYISSGVAKNYEKKNNLESIINSDPYGILKRKDEVEIQKYKNSLVIRIYALSGMFINNPNLFALGNFLKKAVNGDCIKINSKIPIFRSYGNASDICQLASKWFLSNDPKTFNKPIDSVSVTIDLLELAKVISSLYNSVPIECNWDYKSESNSYIADNEGFINCLNEYNLNPKSLKEQILDTSKYFKKKYF